MRTRGFTLAELLVVVTVSAIVVVTALRAWAPIHTNTEHLRQRAHHVSELRLAVDWILADLADAVAVAETVDSELWIQRSPERIAALGLTTPILGWYPPDGGVTYALSGTDLVRTDVDEGTPIVVATAIQAFEVSEPGDGVHVDIVVGTGLGERAIELVWAD